MAVTKVINISVRDGELEELNDQLQRTRTSMDRVEGSAGKAGNKIQELGKNGGAIATLDRLTGGLASQIRDAAEATGVFNFNLKATKAALIATGIGAFVVALGLIVAYWDDIVEFVTRTNEKLKEQIEILDSRAALMDAEFKLLDSQEKLLKAQGKSTDELTEKKKLLLQTQIGVLGAELALLQAQNRRLDNHARELTFWEKISNAAKIASGFGSINTGLSAEEEQGILTRQQEEAALQTRIKELQLLLQGIVNPQAASAGPREKESKVNPLTGEMYDKEIERLSEHFEQIFELDKNNKQALQESADAANEEFLNSELVRQARQTQMEYEESEARKVIAQNEFEAKQRNLYAYADAASAVGDLIGQQTASGKALAAAGALINTYASIAGQLKAFAGVPIPGYAIAQAIATAATGFAAVKNILAVKVPGQGGGGGVAGTTPSTPPAFNVVGNSPQNQLNQALLSQGREPVKAFVVESEMTSAQQLKRNKVNTSSL